jgi:hypothetical protein
VNWTMLLSEIGLGIVLVVLAALMIWRLIDLFKERGRWRSEFEQSRMGRVSAGELTKPPLGKDGEEVLR